MCIACLCDTVYNQKKEKLIYVIHTVNSVQGNLRRFGEVGLKLTNRRSSFFIGCAFPVCGTLLVTDLACSQIHIQTFHSATASVRLSGTEVPLF